MKDAKSMHGVSFKQLDTFVSASWRWPAFHLTSASVKTFFSDVREKSSTESLKGMASELLVIFPFMRPFAYTILEPLGGLEAPIKSLHALCSAIDMLHTAKIGNVNIIELRAAVSLHADLHQAAYGLEHVKPKHHYAHHISSQLARDKMLLDTFVLERKHQPIKQCAQHVKNTSVYEGSVLS